MSKQYTVAAGDTRRNLNKYTDDDDVRQITKLINGGYNGLEDREAKLAVAKKVLGA